MLSTQGVGTTPEEFKAGVADGSIVGHVGFPESVRLISDTLGLGVDRVEQTLEPIIAKHLTQLAVSDPEGIVLTVEGRDLRYFRS